MKKSLAQSRANPTGKRCSSSSVASVLTLYLHFPSLPSFPGEGSHPIHFFSRKQPTTFAPLCPTQQRKKRVYSPVTTFFPSQPTPRHLLSMTSLCFLRRFVITLQHHFSCTYNAQVKRLP